MRPRYFSNLFPENDRSQAWLHWCRGLKYEARGDAGESITDRRANYQAAIEEYSQMAYLEPEILLHQTAKRNRLSWPETEWAWPGYLHFLRYGDDVIRRKAARLLGLLWQGQGADSLQAHLFDSVACAERRLWYSSFPDNYPPMPAGFEEGNARKAIKSVEDALCRIQACEETSVTPEAVEIEVRKRLSRYEYENGSGADVKYDPNDEIPSEVRLADTELMARLSSQDVAIRARACCILAVKGARTWQVYQALEPRLADRQAVVRGSAAHALGRIASSNPELFCQGLLPKMAQRLRADASFWVRCAAAEVLGTIGTQFPDTIPALTEALRTPTAPPARKAKNALKVAAIEALGKCGPAAGGALDLIKGWNPIREDHTAECLIKFEALLRIAPADQALVDQLLPKVIRCLHEDGVWAGEGGRLIAVRALDAVQVGTEEVKQKVSLALCRSMWMDWSRKVRCAARAALASLDSDLAEGAGASCSPSSVLRKCIKSIDSLRKEMAEVLWKRAEAMWADNQRGDEAIHKYCLAMEFDSKYLSIYPA